MTEITLIFAKFYDGMLSKYVPRKGAVLYCFLTVFPPPVTVFKVIDLALRHKCESRLPLTLLLHFLALHLRRRPLQSVN